LKTTNIYKAKNEKSSFTLSTFLQDSSTVTTGLTNLFLRSETRLFLMCGFIELLQNVLDYAVTSLCFSKHQNNSRPALHLDFSSLCNGDSNFNHVLLHSLSVARLARMHQNTITIHCHVKTVDVVR
jgi:hypothetical protein